MMEEPRNLLILGLGVSGKAAAELAVQHNAEVTVLDEQNSATLSERAAGLQARNVRVHLDWNEPAWKEPVDMAVISPGIPPESALGRLARSLSCPVVSEIEYGFYYAECPILAVTGTNGKSTTVELINHCLKQAGYQSAAAGNIGVPLCDTVNRHRNLDYLVVEVSSYQLEGIKRFRPLAAALLNLSPDHLDRYGSADDYYWAKMALFRNMKTAARIVLRHDLLEWPLIKDCLPSASRPPVTFMSQEAPGAAFFLDSDGSLRRASENGGEILCNRRDLRLRGRHNVENVLAAIALLQAAGLDARKFIEGAKRFPPNPHRLELVDVHDGIQFINDSKSTNPDSLIRAIEAMAEETRGKILLLAGGLDKGLDFSQATSYLTNNVKEVFLIGKCREKLAELWQDAALCKIYASLANAFDAALESAEKGDTVLLSPGCASQDMFRDYADRGNQFSQLIIRRFEK